MKFSQQEETNLDKTIFKYVVEVIITIKIGEIARKRTLKLYWDIVEGWKKKGIIRGGGRFNDDDDGKWKKKKRRLEMPCG